MGLITFIFFLHISIDGSSWWVGPFLPQLIGRPIPNSSVTTIRYPHVTHIVASFCWSTMKLLACWFTYLLYILLWWKFPLCHSSCDSLLCCNVTSYSLDMMSKHTWWWLLYGCVWTWDIPRQWISRNREHEVIPHEKLDHGVSLSRLIWEYWWYPLVN